MPVDVLSGEAFHAVVDDRFPRRSCRGAVLFAATRRAGVRRGQGRL